MKFSPSDSATESDRQVQSHELNTRGFWHRIGTRFRNFKQELCAPLPHPPDLSRLGRIRARLKYLCRRYGWKLMVLVFSYYLVRDTLLYIVLPYLVARHIID